MINLKTELHSISKILKYLNLDEVVEMGVMDFLNRDAVFVKGKKGNYIINIVSLKGKDNEYAKNKMTKIKSLEFFDNNGVHAIFPLKFNEKYFINYHNKEYEIYKHFNSRHLSVDEVSDKILKKIATSQAVIHNLNVKLTLPSAYHEVKFKMPSKLKKIEAYSKKGYQELYDNIYQIEGYIKNYNRTVKYSLNNLILGYDHYDLDNIEWINNYMYLVDYENCELINPAVSLAESAYYFANKSSGFDFDTYKLYIETYIKKFGNVTYDFKEALCVAQYKFLVKIDQLVNQSIKEKEDLSEDIVKTVKELKKYNNNLDKLYELYLSIVKK